MTRHDVDWRTPRTKPRQLSGILIVDLTDLAGDKHINDRETDEEIRRRLAVIPTAPAYACVTIRAGNCAPPAVYLFADADISHVRIIVEATDPGVLRKWMWDINGRLSERAG